MILLSILKKDKIQATRGVNGKHLIFRKFFAIVLISTNCLVVLRPLLISLTAISTCILPLQWSSNLNIWTSVKVFKLIWLSGQSGRKSSLEQAVKCGMAITQRSTIFAVPCKFWLRYIAAMYFRTLMRVRCACHWEKQIQIPPIESRKFKYSAAPWCLGCSSQTVDRYCIFMLGDALWTVRRVIFVDVVQASSKGLWGYWIMQRVMCYSLAVPKHWTPITTNDNEALLKNKRGKRHVSLLFEWMGIKCCWLFRNEAKYGTGSLKIRTTWQVANKIHQKFNGYSS